MKYELNIYVRKREKIIISKVNCKVFLEDKSTLV